jgi:hypothetical protein
LVDLSTAIEAKQVGRRATGFTGPNHHQIAHRTDTLLKVLLSDVVRASHDIRRTKLKAKLRILLKGRTGREEAQMKIPEKERKLEKEKRNVQR